MKLTRRKNDVAITLNSIQYLARAHQGSWRVWRNVWGKWVQLADGPRKRQIVEQAERQAANNV